MDRNVIVAAVDVTSLTNRIVSAAATLARTLPGAELHLVHVVAPPGHVVAKGKTEVIDAGRVHLDRVTERMHAVYPGRIVGHLAVGKPWREILQVASDVEADLVVIGSHGKRTTERLLLGSVSEEVVRKAHCPVFVIRPKEYVTDVPEIEPSRHPHVHHESAPPFAVGSMFLHPEE
jgi:nucleotide-binding universal stress UspA family protein